LIAFKPGRLKAELQTLSSFRYFSRTSPCAAPRLTNGFEKRFGFVRFDD
jgi:hypothetical protein